VLQCACTVPFVTRCNSFTMKKVLQADMQLHSSLPYWSSRSLWIAYTIINVQTGGAVKLWACCSIDLSQFVVDPRDRHLEFGPLISMATPQESATIALSHSITLINSGAHCLHKKLWLPIILTVFRYMFLDLSQNVICGLARFRLRYYILRFMAATRSSTSFLLVTCVFPSIGCTHPQLVSLHRQDPIMCLLFCTRNATNSILSFMNSFIMSRRAVILLECLF
jgi:hypothetical protein